MLAAAVSLIILAAALQPHHPSVSPACSKPENRQFDFWLGDWTVLDTATRKTAGHNLVTSIQDACALQEHWTGVDGSSGTSFNTYYAPDRMWHQIWVDNQGLLLRLDGRLLDGKMVLSAPRLTRDGKRVIDRIVWTPERNGNVRQVWDESSDGGKTWRNAFDGTYVKSR